MRERKSIHYRVVRFCPDKQIGERLNVGILASSEAFGRQRFILSDDDRRILDAFGLEAFQSWLRIKVSMRDYLTQSEGTKQVGLFMSPVIDNGLSLELSATQTVLADSFDVELEALAKANNVISIPSLHNGDDVTFADSQALQTDCLPRIVKIVNVSPKILEDDPAAYLQTKRQ